MCVTLGKDHPAISGRCCGDALSGGQLVLSCFDRPAAQRYKTTSGTEWVCVPLSMRLGGKGAQVDEAGAINASVYRLLRDLEANIIGVCGFKRFNGGEETASFLRI